MIPLLHVLSYYRNEDISRLESDCPRLRLDTSVDRTQRESCHGGVAITGLGAMLLIVRKSMQIQACRLKGTAPTSRVDCHKVWVFRPHSSNSAPS